MSKWIGMTIAPAARSLEGRPLGMSCSVMLPEPSRLRLLELGSSFVTALGEQRHPMTGLTTALAADGGRAKGKTDTLKSDRNAAAPLR